jgi:very-short-patch-repair endonuclease
METLTRETIQKIQQNLRKEFLPFAEQLRAEGQSDDDITHALRRYYEAKKKAFFKKTSDSTDFNHILNTYKSNSKIEGRFLFLLDEYGIKLRFQYPIGPFRVDYLVDDFLILELDGPTHNTKEGKAKDRRRDQYLESLGYKIFHISTELLIMAHEAVLSAIKEIVEDNREARRNRHKRNKVEVAA